MTMTITELKPARKKLTIVYIDGEYYGKLDTQTLEEKCIKAGAQLDDEQLGQLARESEYRRAKEKALWLLSVRDHAKGELETKLRKEASPETAAAVCDRMEELGLLDDEGYARRLARELVYTKRMSAKGALYKLMQKGIDKELAEAVINELDVDPVDQIVELIDRKYASKLSDEKDRRRTVAALQRLGYSWSDISTAIGIYEEDY